MLQKVRFFSSITALYLITFGTIGALLYSSHLFGTPVWAVAPQPTFYKKPLPPSVKVTSGTPVRIVIPSAGIDLPLDQGTYDVMTGAWSLSDTHAQYAVMSAEANDHAGTTFVYGHGTDAVFGKIGSHHPPIGAAAQVYTDNGHVFTYVLRDVHDFQPTDTSILQDMQNGQPRLVVQTCTGIFSEWRTMFLFDFNRVSS